MSAFDPASYTRIKFHHDGRILYVQLSNQGRMNAVDGAMHRELAQVFKDIAHDKASEVIVLTGVIRSSWDVLEHSGIPMHSSGGEFHK